MKRLLFALGLWTNLLSLVGVGTFKLTGIAPDWLPIIKDWCFDLVLINTTVMTALQGYPNIPEIRIEPTKNRPF